MTHSHVYKYIVVEDEHLIRRNVIKKITSLSIPLELIGEASNGKDAITLIEKHCPSIVITDIKMPLCDGLELVKYINHNHPNIKSLIISGYNEFQYAQAAIKYNVKDFILKPIKIEELNMSLNNIMILLDSESTKTSSFSIDPYTVTQKDLILLLEQYLQNNFDCEISLGELEEKFGFSSEHLCRIFKKHIGQTPIKYVTKIRINKAKQLLINRSDIAINKVGELVGYKDAFYFSKVFKSNVGLSPSDYRTTHEKSQH